MPTNEDTPQTKTRRSRKASTTEPEAPETAQEAAKQEEASPTQVEPVETPLASMPLALKLARIMADIGDREPEGANSHFSYKYFTDKQLSGIFRGRFAAYGIVMVPEVLEHQIITGTTNKGGTTYLTNLAVRFTLYDGHTGESISGVGFGQGDDPGDKGANKAMTGATKYFLLKMFQIGGESDAEADAATDERTSAPVRSAVRENRPAEVKKTDKGGEVKKGGRQQSASEAQVMKIRLLAKELKMNATGIGKVVEKVTGSTVALTEGKEGEELVALLGSLTPQQLGDVVQRLEMAKARQGDLTEQAEGIFGDMAEAPPAE